jgi:hypothetical protein
VNAIHFQIIASPPGLDLEEGFRDQYWVDRGEREVETKHSGDERQDIWQHFILLVCFAFLTFIPVAFSLFSLSFLSPLPFVNLSLSICTLPIVVRYIPPQFTHSIQLQVPFTLWI